ncbi:unnamed protein product [Blepharisma stoltei]|uniref:Uncharacterized protein n=1 Tax=Blepharisma stoltei TaxID=1481888 RepID=A0AAU9J1A9_9CILI|nr:unnamed protein product [Blepharisma stoltei]
MGILEEKLWLNSQLNRIKRREFSGSNPTERNIARTLAELRDAKQWIQIFGASMGISISWIIFRHIINPKLKIFSSICMVLACREFAYSYFHEDFMNAVKEVLQDYEESE